MEGKKSKWECVVVVLVLVLTGIFVVCAIWLFNENVRLAEIKKSMVVESIEPVLVERQGVDVQFIEVDILEKYADQSAFNSLMSNDGYFVLIETKGKSFVEIETLEFNGQKIIPVERLEYVLAPFYGYLKSSEGIQIVEDYESFTAIKEQSKIGLISKVMLFVLILVFFGIYIFNSFQI